MFFRNSRRKERKAVIFRAKIGGFWQKLGDKARKASRFYTRVRIAESNLRALSYF